MTAFIDISTIYGFLPLLVLKLYDSGSLSGDQNPLLLSETAAEKIFQSNGIVDQVYNIELCRLIVGKAL